MQAGNGTPRRGLSALLAVNAVLLGALAFVTFSDRGEAQGFRARGNYHATVGRAPGTDSGILYVVDENNRQLIAFSFDPNTHKLVGVGGRDLAVDTSRYNGMK